MCFTEEDRCEKGDEQQCCCSSNECITSSVEDTGVLQSRSENEIANGSEMTLPVSSAAKQCTVEPITTSERDEGTVRECQTSESVGVLAGGIVENDTAVATSTLQPNRDTDVSRENRASSETFTFPGISVSGKLEDLFATAGTLLRNRAAPMAKSVPQPMKSILRSIPGLGGAQNKDIAVARSGPPPIIIRAVPGSDGAPITKPGIVTAAVPFTASKYAQSAARQPGERSSLGGNVILSRVGVLQPASSVANPDGQVTSERNDVGAGGRSLPKNGEKTHVVPCRLVYIKNMFQCSICGVRHDTESKIEAHFQKHFAVYACSFCGKQFKAKFHCRKHERQHTEDAPQCSVCGGRFLYLEKHMRVHSEAREKHPCPVCGKEFQTRNYLLMHMQWHSQDGYVCQYCGKQFRTLKCVKFHARTVHLNQKKYRCADCGRAFSTKQNLQTHMAVHSDERPHQCESCGRALKTKAALYTHMLTHSTAGRITCDACGKQFRCRSQLRRHEVLHDGEQS